MFLLFTNYEQLLPYKIIPSYIIWNYLNILFMCNRNHRNGSAEILADTPETSNLRQEM